MSVVTDEENKKLILAAIEASEKAHCPYSKFPVGAALLTKSGKVIQGCNVENAAYPLCTCAERVAITRAIVEAEKPEDREIVSIAVVAKKLVDELPSPCGGCRQVIVEFGSKHDCLVVLAKFRDHESMSTRTLSELKSEGHVEVVKLSDILPRAFVPSALLK